jgi:hypothetical protein
MVMPASRARAVLIGLCTVVACHTGPQYPVMPEPTLRALLAPARPDVLRPGDTTSIDTNDARVYYAAGMASTSDWTPPSAANAAFYWASRVDPSWSQPLYQRWSLLRSSLRRFYETTPAMGDRVDSLVVAAFDRDPADDHNHHQSLVPPGSAGGVLVAHLASGHTGHLVGLCRHHACPWPPHDRLVPDWKMEAQDGVRLGKKNIQYTTLNIQLSSPEELRSPVAAPRLVRRSFSEGGRGAFGCGQKRQLDNDSSATSFPPFNVAVVFGQQHATGTAIGVELLDHTDVAFLIQEIAHGG